MEIDTKNFLSEQIGNDINKFRNADAFIQAGRERMQSLGGPSQLKATINNGIGGEIMEDIVERESLKGEDDFDDATSSLSKELMLAKQIN